MRLQLLKCSLRKKKKKGLKRPPTTLRAHIAMVTGSSAAPISSFLSELRLPKRLLLSLHSSWQQPTAEPPPLPLMSLHLCETQHCNWMPFSAGSRPPP